MTGLRKGKTYDWKDSNLSDFGSEMDKLVKKESAQTETAWDRIKGKLGCTVWRIKQFKVASMKESEFGEFYNGDSYIIMNCYQEEPNTAYEYDIHFWIGKYSTQLNLKALVNQLFSTVILNGGRIDEYGTAAYKTVELDNLLDGLPVQHREVQNYESNLFISYFKAFKIMEGGTESGFNHVEPKEYIPRLLHFSGNKDSIIVRQIPKCAQLIKHDDIYILDQGKELIQWNGIDCNKDEKIKAMRFIGELKLERNASSCVIDDDPSENKNFFKLLDDELHESDRDSNTQEDRGTVLYKISDDSGNMIVEKVKENEDIEKCDINDDVSYSSNWNPDVFILDKAFSLYVIKGKNASPAEKKKGISYAHDFLKDNYNPYKNITVLDMNLDRHLTSKRHRENLPNSICSDSTMNSTLNSAINTGSNANEIKLNI
ncbi:hypothetical protein A3Q56_02425 [Intoshia linei]|uniref:Gelsolin-like domain-containing protein n=1 Tax=Intoshia linei TaxID=1819745 RepID=A0A177B6S8_9BILA|nr:hypothetical protein A3Q56_02425 [Intoshia linei]